MIRILLPILLISALISSQAQEISLTKQSLIAFKQIGQYGFLLVCKGNGKDKIDLKRVSLELELVWETEITIDKPTGYQFNKAYVHLDHDKLLWVVSSEERTNQLQLDVRTGEILSNQSFAIQMQSEGDYRVFAALGKSLLVKDGSRRWLSIDPAGQLAEDSIKVSMGTDMRFGWVDEYNDQLYSYRYKASKNHKIIHLDLRKDDLKKGESQEMYYELELSFSSFTYNSTVDNRLLYFSSHGDHFYAIGKLDHAFDGRYPKTKVTEGFIGFWIAKFDRDMELIYFNEIPFQFFEGMISKDVINQAAVMDIKEDLEGSTLLSIHEKRGVIYHNKYVITLDDKGDFQGLAGGQDQYNFFEYNKQGLRECAVKSKLRLMNDDWSYYASSSLHQMAIIPEYHSPMIQMVKSRAMNSSYTPSELIYNFLAWEDRYYLLEYREQGKGRLSIELIPH